MRRTPDQSSPVRFDTSDELGDYAFHEMKSEDQWFVPEAPDGQSRWDALPESHPLSTAQLHRATAEAGIPPLPGPLKPPLLERRNVRIALLGMVGATLIGLVAMGMGSTHADPGPALAALPVMTTAPAPPAPAAKAAAPAQPLAAAPMPAAAPAKPVAVAPTQMLPAKPAAPVAKPAAPVVRVAHAKPFKHHKVARHSGGIADRFAN